MKLFPPETVSRGLVRVDRGEDFVETLRRLAAAAGWLEAVVSGAGTLELCELRSGGTTETFEDAAILALSGRLVRTGEGCRLTVHVMVLARGNVRSGELVAAMAGEVTLSVDAHVSSTAPSAGVVQSAIRTSPTHRPTPSPAPAPVKARGSSPGSPLVAPMPKGVLPRKRARTFAIEDSDEHENPDVEDGEFLQHPQLGLCEVIGDDGSGGTKIRLSSGKSRVLRLEALKVMPSKVDESGRTVYAVLGPRARR